MLLAITEHPFERNWNQASSLSEALSLKPWLAVAVRSYSNFLMFIVNIVNTNVIFFGYK